MALICGLVKGKSLEVLQTPGFSAIQVGRQEDGCCAWRAGQGVVQQIFGTRMLQ